MRDYLRGLDEITFEKVTNECKAKVEGFSNKDWQDIVEEYNLGIHRDVLRKSFDAPFGGYAQFKNEEKKRLAANTFDKSLMVINDIHLPFEREDVLSLISQHADEITTLVIGGDIMDCENASSFPKVKRGTLTDELVYSYEFVKKVRNILNKDQKIVMINGNHEERLATTIKKMNEKDLQEFLNPNILDMIIDGFTLYRDGKKIKYQGIEGITYIPHWYALVDRLVVCHPKDFSRVKGKMLENVVSHFINKGFEFDGVIFGHTHKMSIGIIDRFENKFAVENPCLCQPHSYSDCGKLGYSPQTYGYTIIKYNDGEKININNVKTYVLDEITNTTDEFKVAL